MQKLMSKQRNVAMVDFHVAAVVDFIDGEPHIIELYAVDDNGKKI